MKIKKLFSVKMEVVFFMAAVEAVAVTAAVAKGLDRSIRDFGVCGVSKRRKFRSLLCGGVEDGLLLS